MDSVLSGHFGFLMKGYSERKVVKNLKKILEIMILRRILVMQYNLDHQRRVLLKNMVRQVLF